MTTECPNCASPAEPDATFCEVCGLEFASGKLPEAPPPPQPMAAEAPSAATGVDDSGWTAVIEPDRAFYDATRAENPDVSIAFPDGMTAVEIPLRGSELLVGRRVDEDNVHPDLDLGADAGVSRRHAKLRRIDAGWEIVDLGSTNGTRVGGATEPIAPDEPVALDDGGYVHLGAWTRLTLRRRDEST